MPRSWALLAVVLAGCLFRDPTESRFFRPEAATLHGGDVEPRSESSVAIRLRPVRGTPFLRERIVWRQSEVEYGFYEERRWSELPASYVQRALETALRQTPGLRLTDDLRAPTLQVDLVAFEEVLTPMHVAAVSLQVSLRDRDRRLLDRIFTAESPIASDAPSETAIAMGRALDDVVVRVATAVHAALRPQRRTKSAAAHTGMSSR